jgi:hypothetical protein
MNGATAALGTEALDLLEGDLAARIRHLGLERNVADLALQGWTIIENAAPLEFFDRLRQAILELIREQRASGKEAVKVAEIDEVAWLAPKRGRIFEEAHCNPKLVALNEFMVGKGFQIYTSGGSAKCEGAAGLALHVDYTAIRPPYPIHCQIFTSLWTCDDWTVEGGCTRLVPGSFKHRRPPVPGEGDDLAIPIECPKGSIIAWDGATWHGSCPRKAGGVRVGFHTPHSRMAVRTVDSYADISDEIVKRNPPVFGRMVGREDAFGKTTNFSPDMAGLERVYQWLNT